VDLPCHFRLAREWLVRVRRQLVERFARSVGVTPRLREALCCFMQQPVGFLAFLFEDRLDRMLLFLHQLLLSLGRTVQLEA
jgi:hypothetical protein